MHSKYLIFRIKKMVPAGEIQTSFALAMGALEAIHSESDIRIHGSFSVNCQRRIAYVRIGSVIGEEFARLFAHFLKVDRGIDCFYVNPAVREGKQLVSDEFAFDFEDFVTPEDFWVKPEKAAAI